MAHINENCWAKILTGRTDWIKKMNELGKEGWIAVWQTYKESEDGMCFEAYFYRRVFVSKQEFAANGGKE